MATSRQQLIEEQEFYQTLDKETRGSCCTCPTLFLLFLGLFALGITGTYLAARSILSIRLDKPKAQIDNSVKLSLPAFDDKSRTSHQIDFSDYDLKPLAQSLSVPLAEKQIKITSAGIIFSGHLVTDSNRLVELQLTPQINQGKFTISQVKMIHGPAEFDSEFSELIGERVGSGISTLVNKRISNPVQSAALRTGHLVLNY